MNTSEKVNRPLRVHIEGNIGSGKSTLLNFLKQKSIVEVHEEPLEKWQNVNGKNLFEQFYNEPKKYSYAFQSYVLLTLAQRNLNISKKPVQVYERSLDSVKECFVKTLIQTKSFTDESKKAVFDEYFAFVKEHFYEEPDLIIYIRTTPSCTIDRIKDRGRSEERKISKNYLTLVHALHEKWIASLKKGKVFIIDENCNFEDLENEYMNCFHAIEQALYNQEFESMHEQLEEFGLSE